MFKFNHGSFKSNQKEWINCRPPEDIAEALNFHEPIIYTDNGNRSKKAKDVLKALEPIISKIGISRVAEISQLDSLGYPVFQTVRPNLFTHVRLGANTGSQGKGPTRDQAKISAIMEGIEGYCQEPKHTDCIYGSYNYLSKQYPVIPPDSIFHKPLARKASQSDNLVWTWVHCIDQATRVLIPAETVFFPFMSADFETQRHFTCGSNGVASGATYLEAVNHALYEVIERYYWGTMEMHGDGLQIDYLYKSEFKNLFEKRLSSKLIDSIGLWAVRFKKGTNVPMVVAIYRSDGLKMRGYGCAASVESAVSRAVSEAVQAMTTIKSGAREDLGSHHKMYHGKYLEKIMSRSAKAPTTFIKRETFAHSSKEQYYKTLRAEFDYLVSWIRKAGFRNICIANLTRVGIEVPVVKVIVPSLPPIFASRGIPDKFFSTKSVQNLSFRIGDLE